MESTTQIFLRISDENDNSLVKGESMVLQYEDRIEIESFTFNMEGKKQTVRQTGGAAANLDFKHVSISKPFDLSSLKLANLLKQRKEFYEARITVDQQLEEKKERQQNAVIVFHLLRGYVTDMKLRTSEGKIGATVREDIELSYRNVEVEYYYKEVDEKTGQREDFRAHCATFATDYQITD